MRRGPVSCLVPVILLACGCASDRVRVYSADARVGPDTTLRDQLAARKLAAGDDPVELRAAASWSREQGLTDEAWELEETARAIDLDRKLAELEGSKSAAPYLELARHMRGTYSDAERRFVLEKAQKLEPDNPLIIAELSRLDAPDVDERVARAVERQREYEAERVIVSTTAPTFYYVDVPLGCSPSYGYSSYGYSSYGPSSYSLVLGGSRGGRWLPRSSGFRGSYTWTQPACPPQPTSSWGHHRRSTIVVRPPVPSPLPPPVRYGNVRIRRGR